MIAIRWFGVGLMTQDNEVLFKDGNNLFVWFEYVVSKSGCEILPLDQNSQKYARSILHRSCQLFFTVPYVNQV